MPDHEFEKKIQDKMTGLRLSPSEPVWERVAEQLNQKDKRRRGLLWLPFLFAAFLGSYYFFSVYNSTERINMTPPQKSSVASEKKLMLPADKKVIIQQHVEFNDLKSKADTTAGLKTVLPSIKTGSNQYKEMDKKPAPGFVYQADQKSINAKVRNFEARERQKEEQKEKLLTEMASDPFISNDVTGNKEMITAPAEYETADKDLLPFPVNSALKHYNDINIFDGTPAPLWKASDYKRASRKKIKPEFGFTFSSGSSRLNNGKFPSLFENKSVPENRLMYVSGNVNASPNNPLSGSPAYVAPSELKPGFAVTFGGYFRQQWTSALRITIGLNYNFYTTSNMLGRAKDTIINPNPNVARFDMLTQVYSTGSSYNYTNRYHFIEMPFLVEGRIINGKLPVNWSGGLTYSRLISSNAVHYDSNYRIYYKNNSLLRKNQVNIKAGLNMELFTSAAHPLEIGPELSYGLTNLLKDQNKDGRHFLYLGMKAAMSLKK